jgi:dolichol-phosphate mannosyltransferase
MAVLILPMYNEKCSIPLLKEQLARSHFAEVDRIIAVNDGSKDNTLELLQEWQRGEPRLCIVSYCLNRGLPGAVTAGFAAALDADSGGPSASNAKQASSSSDKANRTDGGSGCADILITMDADASHPVDLIPGMVRKINEGYDIVIASRYQPDASQRGLTFARKVFSWGASTLMRIFYPIQGLHDYSTNYRAYRASLVKEALQESGGRLVEATGFVGVVELLLRLCSLNPRIAEVPLNLRYDLKESESKMRVWKTVKGYLSLISKERVRSQAGTCLPLLEPEAPSTGQR